MRYLAENYYEAEQLAMMFIESYDGECYTEVEGLAIYVYDKISGEKLLVVGFIE